MAKFEMQAGEPHIRAAILAGSGEAFCAGHDLKEMTVAAKRGGAVRIGKRAFCEQIETPLEQAYIHAGDVMTTYMMIDDTAEEVAVFLGKHKPDWPQ
jgi:enoyl-CoA hydratase/carnithine racemase